MNCSDPAAQRKGVEKRPAVRWTEKSRWGAERGPGEPSQASEPVGLWLGLCLVWGGRGLS